MEMMTDLWLGKPAWVWLGFLMVVGVLLVVDLFVLHRRDHVVSMKESLITTGVYCALAVLFSFWVGHKFGAESAVLYLTGYVVEMSLSMDNVFVMALILGYFHIPRQYQHRVLFWGILGVILLRGVMIGAGALLIQEFHWVLYIFAAFLMLTGLKMLFWTGDEKTDIGKNPILRFLRRYGRVTDELHGRKFFVRLVDGVTGRQAVYMTPLMVALILVEFADVVFAVDSVPAIFAITTDPYIVFTSNIFAVLGLRSLYFALSSLIARFEYLKYALALLLVFIGSKMFVVDMLNLAHFPPLFSLGVTFAILGSGVAYSLWKTNKG